MLLALAFTPAAVVDRVALVIDKKVFTESEVVDEVRITQFLNGQPLDPGPAARHSAADRLVDQELIRRELQASGFQQPAASEADTLLRSFRQSRFRSDADYQAALKKYGITEEQLKQHLLWQLTALRFTDQRFRPEQAAQPADAASQSADRVADELATSDVDRQLDAWLKQARENVQITFKREAFQ